MKNLLTNKTILITGGTGSFGKAFVKRLLDFHSPRSIRILSRDELKQWQMESSFSTHPNFSKLRFFIGDVRDKERLNRAFEDVDIVIHAAALKQVPAAEYNPSECIKTNIMGAENVISAAFNTGVKKVIALSTDKASSPINLYGATKLCSDKLFVAANNMRGSRNISFSVVRYGNVMGSRGSVIPLFINKRKEGVLPITHKDMTRFNITLDKAIELVERVIGEMKGGEIYVPKLKSYKVMDLARAISPSSKKKIVGIRPGEKIHEEMIPETEAQNTLEFKKHFIIMPSYPDWKGNKIVLKRGKKVPISFSYNSGTNTQRLAVGELRELIKNYLYNDFEAI
ncbi:MAG: UDP-N-acetylglucosamine 4,6-dehydratase (inverting) [Candidatus Pacebacteria bacterium RIFOXYA1_FULL_38_18]|nr:MAG: UDP-N-acetylglucosamine 4,6-dehydratase (inverting) [Candidatus Pacebacteria bacterium RIFOXYA1_FULL_38_18]OGJ39465.1 MAG: UDP-N-acetylglucosamine 4,6-dehydratase (inverting) [Candidatus Pacebacteria bacterium RIFOXYC1_FULL_39_21]